METAQIVLEFIKALVWPVTVAFGIWVFRLPITELIARIQRAELPGGGALEFGQGIRDAKEISQEVTTSKEAMPERMEKVIPLAEANARMLSLGLRPSPSGLDPSTYRNLAKEDPNIALASLRMEIEILIRNLAKGFNVPVQDSYPAGRILRLLNDSRAITLEQYRLAQKVLELCNLAIHGTTVSKHEADAVIDIAQVLTDQYLDWLSWGFPER